MSNACKNKASILLDGSLTSEYWNGFILSDGCVFKNRLISIILHERELEHLKKLSNYVGSKISIKSKRIDTFCKDQKIQLSLSDTKNIPKLSLRYDIQPRKTYCGPRYENLFKLNLNKEQFLSLFIGFIDGDGNICVDKHKHNFHFIKVENHSSWIEFHKFLLDKLDEFGVYKRNYNYPKINKYGYSYFKIYTESTIVQLINHIKLNNLPHLERKWNSVNLRNRSNE